MSLRPRSSANLSEMISRSRSTSCRRSRAFFNLCLSTSIDSALLVFELCSSGGVVNAEIYIVTTFEYTVTSEK